MLIISGTSHKELSDNISNILETRTLPCILDKFSDGEIQVDIQENVRNQDIFIIQSGYSNTNPNYNINDYLMETLIIIDACKRSMAKSVNIIMPYYPYSRQDKKDESRSPITAKLVANLLEKSGIDRLVVMDLHSSQIQGFFDIPVDNIYSVGIVLDYFNKNIFNNFTEEEKEDKFIVISPDAGAAKRTLKFAKCMGLDTAIMHKQRNYKKKNTIEKTIVVSDKDSLLNKTAIICDDICDTGGTLIKAVETLINNGISNVIVVITHGILSGPAIERINKCQHITKMIVTNSINQNNNLRLSSKIEVIPIDNLMADVINCLITGESISQFFQ
jgi:ribose-phosphate pyrophosphokinase